MVVENVHVLHAVVRKVKEWTSTKVGAAACAEGIEPGFVYVLKDWLRSRGHSLFHGKWEWWEKDENRYGVLMVLSLVVLLRFSYHLYLVVLSDKGVKGKETLAVYESLKQQKNASLSGLGERVKGNMLRAQKDMKVAQAKIFEEEEEERRPSLTIKTKKDSPKRQRGEKDDWVDDVLEDKERIILKGMVKKWSGFTYRRRFLVLTNKRLFYLDPVTMKLRCDLKLDQGTRVRLFNKKMFSLTTRRKSKRIETHSAEDWVYAITSALKTIQ